MSGLRGGLSYPIQDQYPVFDDVLLTTSYTDHVYTTDQIKFKSAMVFMFSYTTGAGGTANKFDIEISYEDDEGIFYPLNNITTAPAVNQLQPAPFQFNVTTVAATNYTGATGIIAIAGKKMRIRVKEEVAAGAAGTFTLKMLLSGA